MDILSAQILPQKAGVPAVPAGAVAPTATQTTDGAFNALLAGLIKADSGEAVAAPPGTAQSPLAAAAPSIAPSIQPMSAPSAQAAGQARRGAPVLQGGVPVFMAGAAIRHNAQEQTPMPLPPGTASNPLDIVPAVDGRAPAPPAAATLRADGAADRSDSLVPVADDEAAVPVSSDTLVVQPADTAWTPEALPLPTAPKPATSAPADISIPAISGSEPGPSPETAGTGSAQVLDNPVPTQPTQPAPVAATAAPVQPPVTAVAAAPARTVATPTPSGPIARPARAAGAEGVAEQAVPKVSADAGRAADSSSTAEAEADGMTLVAQVPVDAPVEASGAAPAPEPPMPAPSAPAASTVSEDIAAGGADGDAPSRDGASAPLASTSLPKAPADAVRVADVPDAAAASGSGPAEPPGLAPAQLMEQIGQAEQADAGRDWRARVQEDRPAGRNAPERPEPAVAAAASAPQRAAAAAFAEPSANPSPGTGQDLAAAIEPSKQTGEQGGSGYGQQDGAQAEADIQLHAPAAPELQKTGSSDFAQLVANARPVRPGHPAAAPQQIALHIQKAAAEGHDRLTVQLRPADLGRIDVQLDFGKDGTLRAMVTADNAGTLDMLQRDARGLERALQDAGLKTDANGLSFSLRDQGGQAQREHMQERGRNAGLRIANDGAVDAPATPAGAPALTIGPGRVDVRV